MRLQTLGVFAALSCSIHVMVYWAPLWGVLRIPSVPCVWEHYKAKISMEFRTVVGRDRGGRGTQWNLNRISNYYSLESCEPDMVV